MPSELDVKRLVPLLQSRDIWTLHHSNSVLTSCAFLERNALLSRGFVEDNGLKQTSQYTDALDKQLGVWHDVFLDTDDFHRRISAQNKYGPVLFSFAVDVLGKLPAGSEVRVTRSNPAHWHRGTPEAERYYMSVQELAPVLKKGEMAQMLTIRTPSRFLDLPRSTTILLDDPEFECVKDQPAFEVAHARLSDAADRGGFRAEVVKRDCRGGCKCVAAYALGTNRQLYCQ